MLAMNFNLVLKPLRRLQDVIMCSSLLNVFPDGMKNRINCIVNVLNRTVHKDKYTTNEVGLAIEKLENVLPMYGDSPVSISEDFVMKEVIDYIKDSNITQHGYRNLFPPINEWCSMKLDFRSSTKCVVFERCKTVHFQANCLMKFVGNVETHIH